MHKVGFGETLCIIYVKGSSFSLCCFGGSPRCAADFHYFLISVTKLVNPMPISDEKPKSNETLPL